MKKDLERRLLFAKTIAKAAGEVLLVIRDANPPFGRQPYPHPLALLGVRPINPRIYRSFALRHLPRHEEGDQLKSVADLVAQALLTTLLAQHYPGEAIIAEESDSNDLSALKKNRPCWIVDPLDGTRSYHDGFDGFCVQLAYVEKGIVQVGVVYQPVPRVMYSAVRGKGAFREEKKKRVRLPLRITRKTKTYIDSRPAKGAAREILDALGIKKFLECGSFGIKLCKIAEGAADIFLKDAAFKLWDVAPAEVIFHETKNKMTLWNGREVRYDGTMLGGENLLVASVREHRAIRRVL